MWGRAQPAVALFLAPLLCAGASLTPEQWADTRVAACLAAQNDWEARWEKLQKRLEDEAQSADQGAFPNRERLAREKSLQNQRRATLARLDYILLGDQARFLETPLQRFRRKAGARQPEGRHAFRRTLDSLLTRAGSCELDTLEATLLLAVFDLPFEAENASVQRVFEQIDHAYHERFDQTGSLEAVYGTLRPVDPEAAFRYVDELLTRVTSSPASADPERRDLIDRLGKFFRLAAEPLRIRAYLHGKIHETERALRSNIKDRAAERLFAVARQTLYGSPEATRQLAAARPDDTVARLQPVLDRWWQADALPAVLVVLAGDPFAAYWHFVQTGAVDRRPRAFRGSQVALPPETFELESLRGFPLLEALRRLDRERVPPEFLDAHAELERLLTNLVLTRQEALDRIAAAKELPADDKERLRRYATAVGENEAISSIDMYSWVVRDAHKVAGQVDWRLLRAALRLLRDAKRDKMNASSPAVLAFQAAEDRGRLEGYLRAAVGLMLELEVGQATESRLRLSTGGAVVGWFLRLVMSTGVPVELWAPGGVTGAEFRELIDELTPKNRSSGNLYRGKPATGLRLVHDGREYHQSVIALVDQAQNFLNIAAFDWAPDQGGKDIAARLMAKKLGIEGPAYRAFLDSFSRGLPLEPGAPTAPLYDIPLARMKSLLFYHHFQTSADPAIAEARRRIEAALGSAPGCLAVAACGDLSALRQRAGASYRPAQGSDPAYQQVWEAFRAVQGLFQDRPPELRDTRPRATLGDYVADTGRLRGFLRRHGRRRGDNQAEPFPIHVIADGKRNFSHLRFGQASRHFPFFARDAIEDVYRPMLEFDIKLLLWKGVPEYPWSLGPLRAPGRKIFGVLPMPFAPYPWLNRLPGVRWAGSRLSVFLQFLLAGDPRLFWSMTSHTKSMSSEAAAIESGLGFGSKYFNYHDDFRTWHDMSALVRGPLVGDVNDHFVQVFNQARVNNSGLPGASRVKTPKLRYPDFASPPIAAADGDTKHPAWLLTTHPEEQDYNYRGVFLAALAAARRNIFIENSFFSDPLVARMLLRKAREFRGRVNCAGLGEAECAERMREAVAIYLVLPDSSDKPVLDAVGAADVHEMLHLGIKIYRWNPPAGWSASKMLHTKAWLIDYEEAEPAKPALAYVGSANATQRSHLADNEAGIVSTSPEFAREVYERVFRADLQRDARLEVAENFHVVWSSNSAVRTAKRLRALAVSLFWMF